MARGRKTRIKVVYELHATPDAFSQRILIPLHHYRVSQAEPAEF